MQPQPGWRSSSDPVFGVSGFACLGSADSQKSVDDQCIKPSPSNYVFTVTNSVTGLENGGRRRMCTEQQRVCWNTNAFDGFVGIGFDFRNTGWM
jgi:hypothetical protein